MAQGVKAPVLSMPWCWLQLCCWLDPWPRNFHMPQMKPKKKKKERKEKKKKKSDVEMQRKQKSQNNFENLFSCYFLH